MSAGAADVDFADLRRRCRSSVEERRPVCPSCGTRAPEDAALEWLHAFGHRCPHGEPCKTWGDPSEYVTSCVECLPAGSSRWTGATTTPKGRSAAPPPARAPKQEAPKREAKPKGESMPTTRGKLWEHQGEKKTAAEWLRDPRHTAGISDKLFSYRLGAGWSIGDALTVPKGVRVGGAKGSKKKSAAKTKVPTATAKAKAGAALNKLFDPPATSHRDTKQDNGRGAALDLIVADVAARAAELEQLRGTANTLASLWGLPLPFTTAENNV